MRLSQRLLALEKSLAIEGGDEAELEALREQLIEE
jgi:hypothetical protein